MASILKERGFSYYSFENNTAAIGIDDSRDFYNEDHMNVYGAIKFTDFLADCLVNGENLRIDPQTDSQKAMWEDVVTTTNQLYRYCDDLMSSGEEERGAQEDVITLDALEKYSGDTIVRE